MKRPSAQSVFYTVGAAAAIAVLLRLGEEALAHWHLMQHVQAAAGIG